MLGLPKRSYFPRSTAYRSARNISGTVSVHATFGTRAAQKKENSQEKVKNKDLGINARIRAEEEGGFGFIPRTQAETPADDKPEPGPNTRTPRPITPIDKNLTWATLSNIESKDLPAMLLQVDYLPDETTEEDLVKLFSEHGRVSGVMFRQSRRVDRFFGRSFVLMASEGDARRAFVAAGKEGLVLHGEGLAVELVHRPPDATSVLYVYGLRGPQNDVERDMETMFSSFGEVKSINYVEETRYCHVAFKTVGAAEKAVASHIRQRLRYREEELVVDFSFHTPSRVLHITGFTGTVKYLCSFFREYIDYADWVNVANSSGFRKDSVGWVQFDNVDHASAVRDILLDRGMTVSYSRQETYPREWTWNVPPSYKTLVEYAPSEKERENAAGTALQKLEAAISKPVLDTHVLHLRSVPKTATSVDIDSKLQSVGLAAPFFIHPVLSVVGDKFTGRALVSFESKEDAVRVKQMHKKVPLHIRGTPIEVNTALLPRLNARKPVLMVDRMEDLDREAQKEVWDQVSEFGDIRRMWKGIDTNYYVEFATTVEAILCLETHALRPMVVRGRKVRVNFAPSLDGREHGQVFRKIIWESDHAEDTV